jgi:hypothetical protein
LKGGAFQLQALLEEFRLERGFISMKGGAFQLKALLEEFRLERGFISSLNPSNNALLVSLERREQ